MNCKPSNKTILILGFLSACLIDVVMATGTFYYFAYGSNLLAKRIHIQNPTAVRKGFGYLKRDGEELRQQ
ncbi:uncharacterized protein LOC1272591 isoform X3 [Anopheles gambiae]|uniref:uncharacterized protein LOC1272591 isoform X3 n=1 Tax=Anopheles gambiae TaxID=7165 RepID=UPI002AC908D4|nr:uncharacterized protein LOC1272591 isoform X3 [Anopheles gambiae]